MALTATNKGLTNVTFGAGGIVSAYLIELAWAATDTHAALASVAMPTGLSTTQGIILSCPGMTYSQVYAEIVAGMLSRFDKHAWVSNKKTNNGTTFFADVIRTVTPPIAQIFQGATGNL